MLKKLVKLVIGLALLPVCAGVSLAAYNMLGQLRPFGKAQVFFIGGMAGYAALHLFVIQPQYLYVFGHESVHALFARLFGGRVEKFRAGKKGGSVSSTKSNFIITLAPYFFPLYTIIIGLVFLLLKLFYPPAGRFTPLFLSLFGFFLAFHVVMTANALRARQTDVTQNGYVFSFAIIYICNIIILMTILGLVFENIAVTAFLQAAFAHTRKIAEQIFRYLAGLCARNFK